MRFVAIDQVRGLAIFAMILAHFGPGFWERIGLQGMLLDILTLIGRFATPTFIALFAFTVAFAYIPKAKTDPASVRRKLMYRSGKVLGAALITALPTIFFTINSDAHWGGSIYLNLLINIYGVLSFYAIAILAMAILIPAISSGGLHTPVLLGSVLIFIGTFLGYDYWQNGEPSAVELVRLYFVSGKYAFLTNFGLILMLLPFSWHLRELKSRGESIGAFILTSGIVLTLLGLSLGRIVGWRSLSDLHSKYGAPPQIWYLILVVGVMLVLLYVLDRFRFPAFSFIFEHIGRNPLSIYVAHAFVLPVVAALRSLFPGIPGLIAIAVPMTVFLSYCAFVIFRSANSSAHFSLTKQRASL